jgi:hypothetical protein
VRVGDFEVNDFDVNLVAPWFATGQRIEGTARILHELSSVDTSGVSGTDERMPRMKAPSALFATPSCIGFRSTYTIAVSTPASPSSRRTLLNRRAGAPDANLDSHRVACSTSGNAVRFNDTKFRRA